MKIYYAHHMSWYGTDREAADVQAILARSPLNTELVNPNTPEFADKVRVANENHMPMQPFFAAVEYCDAIAYRTFDDDYIGAGVAQELLTAAIHGKQIFRIMDLTRDKGPMLFEQAGLRVSFGPKVLTIVETRDRIKRRVQ